MRHLSFEGEHIILTEVLDGQRHDKAAIASDRNRLQALGVLKRFQNGSSGIVLIRQPVALDLHTGETVFRVWVLRERLHVRFKPGDKAIVLLDLFREIAKHIVLQLVLLAVVAGFHNL